MTTFNEQFNEQYRVVSVESQRLVVRGVRSGEVLTIVNSQPDVPLRQEDYPVGGLIRLTDLSIAPKN